MRASTSKEQHMKHRYTLGIIAAFAFAGCGGSLVAPTGGAPQSLATATHGKSWILPEAKSEDLIYAVGGCDGTCVFSYPAGKLVGALTTSGTSACSDINGNAFFPDNSQVLEYAHGGTSPIATLTLPGGTSSLGCSVDPRTGNLAVVFTGSEGDIAIFPGAKAQATVYASGISSRFCGYDNSGNLFVDGYGPPYHPGLSELPSGASSFTKLSVSLDVGNPGQVQWDGHYITWGSRWSNHDAAVSELSISGSDAAIVSTTRYKALRPGYSWIYDKQLFIPFFRNTNHGGTQAVGVWSYVKGGKPTKAIHAKGVTYGIYSVTISVPK
jgi:hypothetical protein